jgi:hypothetical protein
VKVVNKSNLQPKTPSRVTLTRDNIQDWLELDEGEPGVQLLTKEEMAAVIFFYLFSSALPILLNCPFICFLSFFIF